jgi:Flp pilus assembly protein TadG
MKNHTSAHRKLARAQSLVEFAISLTVILLLLSGAVSFGMAYFSYVSLRDAAQEGALYESINGDATNGSLTSTELNAICARVQAVSTSPVNLSNFTCNPGSNAGNNINVQITGKPCEDPLNPGADAVTVFVSYDYPILVPYVGAIIGSNTIHLTANVTDAMLSPMCNP